MVGGKESKKSVKPEDEKMTARRRRGRTGCKDKKMERSIGKGGEMQEAVRGGNESKRT